MTAATTSREAEPAASKPGRADPDLSVVVATEGLETVARMADCLRVQTAAEQIELVIVAAAGRSLRPDPAVEEALHTVRVLERGSVAPLSEARAEGVRAARADVVAFGETHSFPEPGWAKALIEAHRGPWAGVGPAIEIANPATALSRAAMLIDFVRWMDPERDEEVDLLPPHNTSFKRDVLLAYGDALPSMLEEDLLMMRDLRRRGHRLRLEPAARTRHVNVSRVRSSLVVRLHDGLDFAGTRCRDWPPWRRWAYVLGGPLIPLARLRPILRELRRVDAPALRRPTTLAWLAIGLAAVSVGEAIGYARSGPRSTKALDWEIYRIERHVNARDRRLLGAA